MFKTVTVPTHFGIAYQGQRAVQADEIDSDQLAADLNNALNQLETDGFDIVSVHPVTSGKMETGLHGLEAGWGYGYGFTSAFIIVARKAASTSSGTTPPPPRRPSPQHPAEPGLIV